MSVSEKDKEKTTDDTYEISLKAVLEWLAKSRRTMLLWAGGALILGAIYAFLSPNQFTTTIRIMPELKSSAAGGSMGDLKSLAGLAGVNLDNVTGSTDAIRPDLYPDVLGSIPFALYILRQPVYVAELKKNLSLQAYLAWHANQTVVGGLQQFFSNLFSRGSATTNSTDPSRTLTITPEQEAWSKEVYERISAGIDKKSGIITISVQMPDRVVAATVGRQTLEYLTQYVTDYRTGKASQQVKFLEEQVRSTRSRYQAAEYAVSAWRDRNQTVYLQTAKIEEQRLQNDYLLAQTVYNEMAKQLEQARIKVQEEAPVFKTLDPPSVPLRKSGPKRLVIMIAFTIFGALAGLVVSFVRQFMNRIV